MPYKYQLFIQKSVKKLPKTHRYLISLIPKVIGFSINFVFMNK